MAHMVVGFVALLVAVIVFGSNFVIVKAYDVGDGIWQLAMALGAWITGLVTVIIKCAISGSPMYFFHPIAMSTGLIYAFANLLTAPIFQTIGMALGMSIWFATQLVTGWSTGKWGLLGTPIDTTIQIEWLNYLGVVLVLVSLVLFFMVKPHNVKAIQKEEVYYKKEEDDSYKTPSKKATKLLNCDNLENVFSPYDINSLPTFAVDEDSGTLSPPYRSYSDHASGKKSSWVDRLNPTQKTILGITLSILSGFLKGIMFTPIQAMINDKSNKREYSGNMIDYVWIMYNGMLIGALSFFAIYNIGMRNRPFINVDSVFPSLLGGIAWGIGMNGYYIALDQNYLGVDTTFPIVTAAPLVMSSLWGALYYKEIRGKRNHRFLIAAISCCLVAVCLVSLSKFNL